MPSKVNDLLSHIYGPYKENLILRSDFPRPGVKLNMNDLALYFQGDPVMTGFDETEFITTPPQGSRIAENPNVVFIGVIEIEDLDWLSEEGLQMLEKDFIDMDRKMHMEHSQTNMSIQQYYTSYKRSGSPNLRVRICCCKTLLAHYLTSKNDFEKFLIYSEFQQKKRTYHIRSLHVGTLNLSHKFIRRYLLRAMIIELIGNDPDETPLEERNVDWVIQQYFKEIRPRDKDLRLYEEIGHNYAPRHLRHIPRAQIRGYLAEHADWLLAHMIARRHGSANLLDIPQWISFCQQARRDSIQAASKGVKWGSSSDAGDGRLHKLASRLAQFGESEHFWAKQLRLIQNRMSTQTSTKARELSPEALLPEDMDTAEKNTSFQYDPDFSDSSSGSSDSDNDSDSRVIEVASKFCFEEPHIRNGSFVWNCSGCSYQIDLLNLTPENLAVLPPDTARVLLSKAWKISDPPIKRAFFCMVSIHYEVDHLERQEGIRVIQTSANTWKAVLKDAKKSQPNAQAPVQKSPSIKEEGDSQPLRRSNRSSCPLNRGSTS